MAVFIGYYGGDDDDDDDDDDEDDEDDEDLRVPFLEPLQSQCIFSWIQWDFAGEESTLWRYRASMNQSYRAFLRDFLHQS